MTFQRFTVLALLTLSAAGMAGEPLLPAFDAYSALQTALASDNYDAAKTQLANLEKAVGSVATENLNAQAKAAWNAQSGALAAGLKAAASTADLDALRVQFEPISNAMIALYNGAHLHGLTQYHCPMALDGKGANWLQKEETIANPYFGSAMLRCGAKVGGHSHQH